MIIKKYFIPNFISLSSILCGFIAIILSSYNPINVKLVGLVIIIGAIFDGLDGSIARALNATNSMEKEMDSLADMTTFGIATGIFVYHGSLYIYGNLGILIASLIPICGAIRLARFNLAPTKGGFQGVPTTWVGISLAILQGFYANFFPPYFFLIFTLGVCLLMVSKFHYYKPTRIFWKLKSSKFIIIMTGLVFMSRTISLIIQHAQARSIIDIFSYISKGFALAILIPLFWFTVSGIFNKLTHRQNAEEALNNYKIKF